MKEANFKRGSETVAIFVPPAAAAFDSTAAWPPSCFVASVLVLLSGMLPLESPAGSETFFSLSSPSAFIEAPLVLALASGLLPLAVPPEGGWFLASGVVPVLTWVFGGMFGVTLLPSDPTSAFLLSDAAKPRM